jgi:hypothetical protein
MVVCFWRFSLALLLAAVLAAPGCAGSEDDLPREAVSGTVTLDGKPLADGSIQFTPATNAGGTAVGGGSTIENGRFSIAREKGLVPGSYKVAISAADQKKRDEPTKGPVNKRSGLAKELIPAKYNSQTTLTAEIKKGGSDDLKFDLQSQ